MKAEVSLITLSLNKKAYVENLNNSISEVAAKIRFPFEHLVVDNGDDGTDEIPGLNFIRHDNSGNFATMNNMAVKYAQGETLIFLNNDMIAQTDFITDMHLILKNNVHVGIVGACLFYPDRKLQHAGVMIQPDLFPANLGEKAMSTCNLDPKIVHPSFWTQPVQIMQAVTGACLAIRKQDFINLGGFHEEFNWNFEDVDLCFRMRYWLNKLSIVSRSSILTHLESQTELAGGRRVEVPLGLLQGRWRGTVRTDVERFFRYPEPVNKKQDLADRPTDGNGPTASSH